MKIKLVFMDWKKEGISVYNEKEGINLTKGDFHSGTTWDGVIYLNNRENQKELERAIIDGYNPCFWVTK